jgi:urea transport system ATP-binding protein
MLEARDLDQYYGSSHTLRRASIAVPEGSCTCIMGRNGVGKTTLLKAIMGLLPLRGGSVRFGGRELVGADPAARARAGVGYVPQGRDIFADLTVQENLMVGVLARGRRSIPELVFRLFPVLATMLRRRGGDLSGGQQQRRVGERFFLMDRGAVVASGAMAELGDELVRKLLTV